MMKYIFSLLLLTGLTVSMNGSRNAHATTIPPRNERITAHDSIIYLADSLFDSLAPALEEITQKDFEKYVRSSRPTCGIDTGGFIMGYGLTFTHRCDEICDTYLKENSSGIQLLLPSGYDAGIIGVDFSASCSSMLVYSSYDGPGYSDYYAARAEVYVFRLAPVKGLAAVRPHVRFYTRDWSIADVTWINDNTIAMKVYAEDRTGDGSGLHYRYFRVSLLP